MFNLAHISDVHLAPMPKISGFQLINKRITGYLNWKLNRRNSMADGTLEKLIAHMHGANPDHILVSGDLVNLALPAEIERMKGWLAKLGSPNEVSVTLGNHDAYVPGAAKKCMASWSEYLTGDDGSTPHFPYLRERDDVALVVCNSGCATLPFFATGRFDKAQQQATQHLIEQARASGKFVVVMIHHPPFINATSHAKRLIGDQLFRDMISKTGANLVLHGHTHLVSFEWIDGPDHSVPVIGVPSASHASASAETSTHSKPGARYNLFSIEKGAGGWSCFHQEWGFGTGSTELSLLAERPIYENGRAISLGTQGES